MSCAKLFRGQDISCQSNYKKYYQQVVLVNKDDVESFVIKATISADGSVGFSDYYHRIRFSLKAGKTGYLFRGQPNGNGYYALFSKELDENIPQYIHTVQLPIFGAKETTKILLKTLDLAKYFAAIQYMDGTVEIYGFENGLTTDDYDFDLQNNGGGSFITLTSPESGMEDEPPYIYVPLTGSANEDFNNLFVDIPDVNLGDFSNDFSDDFDIT
jgi:hypothetical protein